MHEHESGSPYLILTTDRCSGTSQRTRPNRFSALCRTSLSRWAIVRSAKSQSAKPSRRRLLMRYSTLGWNWRLSNRDRRACSPRPEVSGSSRHRYPSDHLTVSVLVTHLADRCVTVCLLVGRCRRCCSTRMPPARSWPPDWSAQPPCPPKPRSRRCSPAAILTSISQTRLLCTSRLRVPPDEQRHRRLVGNPIRQLDR